MDHIVTSHHTGQNPYLLRLSNSLDQASSVQVFSGGGAVSEQSNMTISKINTLFERVLAGERPVFVFDIDGTLMEGGLEVGTKQDKTVLQYIENHKEQFDIFRQRLHTFKSRYHGEIVVCTGRGRAFAEMLSIVLFGEGLVDKIISEGGGMIQDQRGARVISDIEPHIPELLKHKDALISFVIEELGGTFEPGKDICISFNPPEGMEMSIFRSRIEDFLQQRGADMSHIYVTNSNSAVDINPHGIDKLIAMQSEVEDGIVVYFGDAANDRTAMEQFAHINVTPANAHPTLQDDVVKLSGSQEQSRSLMGITGIGKEIYGVNQGLQYILSLYESLDASELRKLLEKLRVHVIRDILQIEKYEEFGIQSQLMLSDGNIDTGPLYDKVFFKASSIEQNPEGVMIQISGKDGFVRLNEKVPVSGFPTVGDLRESDEQGVLFSGVAAITIDTGDGLIVPLLKRDAGAPTDPDKYTLPAGRADKTPGKVALEELIEELVIFGKKDGKLVQIVPFTPSEISAEKARKLAEVAKNKYISSELSSGRSIGDMNKYMSLEVALETLVIPEGGKKVITQIDGKQVEEYGIHPYHDKRVNTWEMIRSFQLDLSNFSELTFGDGDGFGRQISIFSTEELGDMDPSDQVTSLQNAIKMGAIKNSSK